MPRVHVETLSLQRQHVSSYVLRWASVIKGKGPSSGEMLTLDCDLWRSSPPHRRDVSCTFRIETVQPLLPLIGTSTMCLQCDPCVSEAVVMSNPRVFFSDLKSGKCSSAVEARLLRFWEAKNVKRCGELMWVDLLLIDVNSTMMQATIYANRLSRFRSKLAAGTMFTISGFDVTRCAQNFRLTDSPLMIRFNDSTAFDELTKPVSPLPEEGFRFLDHSELIGLANTNAHLPESTHGKLATIKLDKDSTVTLSLFESQAETFHKRLEDMHGDPKVVVATSINPKMIGGGLFLNATSGTHVYFDKETKAGEYYFYKLVARDNGVSSAAPLLKGYAKVETLTISELTSFVASAQPQSLINQLQDIDFVCTGKVVRLDVDKGWCYVACAKCSKKLQRTVSALECLRCNNPNAVGVLRYRLELAIADSTAEGTFVCFDGVMTKLHNRKNYVMYDN
ncbi:hypothetical protein HID58_065957 [Brassica napus]|uniref:Replication factor A C-terminal domain-containing protein n=1 Tax=Brassica napus TaxID=3708 RepID=A0ABQ7ZEL3_BRANA|nr:hypothetical protein HID58_065957 [Brassica napus]